MKNEFLSRLIEEFKFLNKVPKFQLERAISPLLAIFILDVINKECSEASVINYYPEFPLKKRGSKQSTNIDWLLADEKNKTLYCVELKTDSKSYDKEQNKIYKSTKKKVERFGAAFLLKGLKSISKKSNRSDKYSDYLNKFNLKKKDLKDYKKFFIVYLAPDKPDNQDIFSDSLILFNKLPEDLGTDNFKTEWIQLLKFLKSLSPKDEEK